MSRFDLSARCVPGAIVTGLALLFATSSGAAQDVRRLEAVGAVPIAADSAPSQAPREEAIQRALLEAVTRVAAGFLLERPTHDASSDSGPVGGPARTPGAEEPDLRRVLGRNLVQYAAHYRILEDRGEQPALFAGEQGVETEYVVIVEVHVDVDRVKGKLVQAGLITDDAVVVISRSVSVEVEGLESYAAYEAVVALLLEHAGARQVIPLEFTRGRALLGVEAEGGPAEVLDRLYSAAPPGLAIVPLRADAYGLSIAVEWTPVDPNADEVAPWREEGAAGGASERLPASADSSSLGSRSPAAGTGRTGRRGAR